MTEGLLRSWVSGLPTAMASITINSTMPSRVDAGLIGLTPVGLCKDEPFGALLVEFTDETTCSCYEGVLKFGKHEINTN
jgi:hypothetical protein